MFQNLIVAVYTGVFWAGITLLIFRSSAMTCLIIFMLFFLSIPQFLWWWIEIKYFTKQPRPYTGNSVGHMTETSKPRVALLGNGVAAGHGVDCRKKTLGEYLSTAGYAVFGTNSGPFSGITELAKIADDLFGDYAAIILCVSTEEAFPWGDSLNTLGDAFYTTLLMCRGHTGRIIVLDCSGLQRKPPIWWLDNYMDHRAQKLHRKMRSLVDDFTGQHQVDISILNYAHPISESIHGWSYQYLADYLLAFLNSQAS